MTALFAGMADIIVSTFRHEAAITVTPSGEPSREIVAAFQILTEDVGVGLAQGAPVLSARTADVSDLTDGDVVMVGATEYVFRVAYPDGEGLTMVELERA